MRKSTFIIAGFVLIIVVVPLFVIWPSAKSILEMSKLISDEYRFLEERNVRGLHMKEAAKEYETYASEAPALQQLAIAQGDELGFITAVEKIATDYKVTQTLHLDFDRKIPRNGKTTIPLTLNIQGSYQNALGFFHALESLPPVVSIQTVRVEPLTSAQGTSVTISLVGFVYQHLP